MVKELKIAGKTYTFKDNLMGLDLLATLEENSAEWKALKSAVGLIARASMSPKLSIKKVFMLPYGEFTKMVKGVQELYGVPADFGFLEEE